MYFAHAIPQVEQVNAVEDDARLAGRIDKFTGCSFGEVDGAPL